MNIIIGIWNLPLNNIGVVFSFCVFEADNIRFSTRHLEVTDDQNDTLKKFMTVTDNVSEALD